MNKKQLLQSFQELKNEIDKLRSKHIVQGLKDKFISEKKMLEKKIEKTVVEEMKKAKKFMTEQKKELNKIQKKVEAAVSKKAKPSTKKVVSKKATKKTVTKATKKKAN